MATKSATAPAEETEVPPVAIKVAKGTAGAALVASAGWSALAVAGGVTLAVTTGGIGIMALGGAAALIGAQRAYARLRAIRTAHDNLDGAVSGKTPAAANTRTNKFLRNPVVRLTSAAVILSAGVALVGATAGILPLAFGAAMIASGSVGTITGAFSTVLSGIKLVAKALKKDKKVVIVGDDDPAQKPAPQKPQEPKEPKSALTDLSVKKEFVAAANSNAPAPTVKPVIPKKALAIG